MVADDAGFSSVEPGRIDRGSSLFFVPSVSPKRARETAVSGRLPRPADVRDGRCCADRRTGAFSGVSGRVSHGLPGRRSTSVPVFCGPAAECAPHHRGPRRIAARSSAMRRLSGIGRTGAFPVCRMRRAHVLFAGAGTVERNSTFFAIFVSAICEGCNIRTMIHRLFPDSRNFDIFATR